MVQAAEQQQAVADAGVDGENSTWIFCYGSNTPRQISMRINKPYDEIVEKMVPAKLYGYLRAFVNKSRHCGTSPATVMPTGNPEDFVEGMAVHFTNEEISRMDPFEGYPDWYNRENVTLELFMKN